MNRPFLSILLLAYLFACKGESNQISATRQAERVREAAAELEKEKSRLKDLQDSLSVKVEQNVELGMTPEQARAVEEALIDVQKTVVTAAANHLEHQKELLALTQSGSPSP